MNEIRDGEELIKISGMIEKIVYQNEENGYTVCDIATDDDELVTSVGIMPYLCEGESIVMPRNVPHAVYGEQRFKMLLTVVF